jgi:hypothetical protein
MNYSIAPQNGLTAYLALVGIIALVLAAALLVERVFS